MTTKNLLSFKIKQIKYFFHYGKCLEEACQLFNNLQQTPVSVAPRLVHELIHSFHLCEKQITNQTLKIFDGYF